jgi:hypothetical protein
LTNKSGTLKTIPRSPSSKKSRFNRNPLSEKAADNPPENANAAADADSMAISEDPLDSAAARETTKRNKTPQPRDVGKNGGFLICRPYGKIDSNANNPNLGARTGKTLPTTSYKTNSARRNDQHIIDTVT